MSFFRPEAVAAIRRWAVSLGLIIAGGVIAATWGPRLWRGDLFALLPLAFALLLWVGAAGAAQTAFAGLWARFGGPGLVTIDEGRISYFGPLGGAILALDAIVAVDIVAGPQIPGGRAWRISDSMGQQAVIPAGATGAVRLLDSLGTLPDFDVMMAVAAMERATPGNRPFWRRDGGALAATAG
ncbi:MAG: hypothetical protein AAF674_19560 [Pseudomonadota bacterium]